MPDPTKSQQPKLLDEVRQVLRLHHYSIHTERSYVNWIVRFVRFHDMRSRDDLFPAEPKIEAFLTDLAVRGNVASATQNQAMNALVFFFKQVVGTELGEFQDLTRAKKPKRLPTVLSGPEVKRLLIGMEGLPLLMAGLLYGSGMRLMEVVRLRVKDVDFDLGQILLLGHRALLGLLLLAQQIVVEDELITIVHEQGG